MITGGLLAAPVAVAEVETHGAIGTFLASGDRAMDDASGVGGVTAGLRLEGQTEDGMDFRADALGQERLVEGEQDGVAYLREGWLGFSVGPAMLRMGRQVIVWGRADRFNPTDYFSPRDFELVSADEDAQRKGVTGVSADWFMSDEVTVGVVLLPFFEGSRLPQGLFPEGFDASPPHHGPGPNEIGVKLDYTSAAVDASLSWFDGHSTLPTVSVDAMGEAHLVAQRMRALGADFAKAWGGFIVRGEAAQVWLERGALDGLLAGDYFYGVLGLEHAFGMSGHLSLQWLHRESWGRPDPAGLSPSLAPIAEMNAVLHQQTRKRQDGLAARVAFDWDSESSTAELGVVYLADPYGFAVRPKVQKALDDHWKATLFAEFLGGSNKSLYGRLEDNSLVSFDLKYEF